jgi:hypothetical protein
LFGELVMGGETNGKVERRRTDMQAELTKLLRHGYGSLRVKVVGHQIVSLEVLSLVRLSALATPAGDRDDET